MPNEALRNLLVMLKRAESPRNGLWESPLDSVLWGDRNAKLLYRHQEGTVHWPWRQRTWRQGLPQQQL